MDITEVRIKLMDTDPEERLLGFCSITFDHSFVIRDLKIIRGGKGFFVAMPSRKLTDRCPGCGGKNQLRATYCNHCGVQLENDRSYKQSNGKAKLYSDIAHPINSECRDLIQEKVLQAYEQELILSEQPDYICRYEDYGEGDSSADYDHVYFEGPGDLASNLRLDRPQSNHSPHRDRTWQKEPAPRNHNDEFGEGLF